MKHIQKFFDHIDSIVFQVDKEFYIEYLNQSAKRLFGENAKGRFCFEVTDGQNQFCSDCPARTIFSGERKAGSDRKWVLSSGREIYVHCVAEPVEDEAGNICGAVILATDITAHRQEKEDLLSRIAKQNQDITLLNRKLEDQQESGEKTIAELEAIIDALPGMVAVVDRDFHTLHANQAVVDRFGNSKKSEVLGKKCYIVRKQLDAPCHQCAIEEAFSTGQPISRISTPEEEKLMGIATQSYAIPLKDKNGKIWAGVEVIMDVSELRAQERSLAESREELQAEIEQRKQVEKELRQSEERLDLALSGANEGIWDWEIKSGNIHFDPRYYTISGYEPNEYPAAFEEWRKRVHPDDVEAATRAIEEYLSGNTSTYDMEFRFLHKNGDYMWIQAKGKSVEFDETGQPLRFIGTHADITERKIVVESAQISQFVYDRAAVGIYRINSDARIIGVNDKAAEMLGYTPEEMSELRIHDIDPAINDESWGPVWKTLLDKGLDEFETSHLRKDKTMLPVQISSNLIEFQGQQYSVAFVTDISERKESEKQLDRLRNYLSNIINSMPSILVGVDHELKITLWNSQAELETGMNADEVISKRLETAIPRLQSHLDKIEHAIRKRRIQRDIKSQTTSGDDIRFEEITIYPLVPNDVEGAVIRIDDITERVRMEEMMVQSEKMLTIGGLAAGMAHEINNPLSGMIQAAQILNARLTSDLRANIQAAESAGTSLMAIRKYIELRKIDRSLNSITMSGAKAANIIQNMLNYARKSDKVRSTQDLCALLDETIELLKTDYDMKKGYDFQKIDMRREYDPDATPVSCEGSKIQQVFVNILKNGSEAMAMGTADGSTPAFILRVRDDDPYVTVEIEDNGPGMDENTQQRIFEPFFTTKPIGKGTGLGMSVSFFIITQDHKGKMAVDSTQGKGTCFSISLPKSD